MADTSTVRAQRARLHKRHDHSMCRPERCRHAWAEAELDLVVTTDAGDSRRKTELGPSGSALWQEMTSDGPLPALQAVLLLEACRMADRLDKLNDQLRGEDWLRFVADESGSAVTVLVDKPLSEARQQATALKGIVAELRQASGRTGSKSPRASSVGAKGAGGIADITARIAERRAASSD